MRKETAEKIQFNKIGFDPKENMCVFARSEADKSVLVKFPQWWVFFDCADPVVRLLLLKSSMATPYYMKEGHMSYLMVSSMEKVNEFGP